MITLSKIFIVSVLLLMPVSSRCAEANLSIKFLEDPCFYSISLSNPGKTPLHYIDSFGGCRNKTGVRNKADIPAFTFVYVKDQEGRLLSRMAGWNDSGYSFIILRSQIDPMPLMVLKPGESVDVEYSLEKICLGLFDWTQAKRNAADTYRMQLKTKVFLDEGMKTFVEAETDWIRIPSCLKKGPVNQPSRHPK